MNHSPQRALGQRVRALRAERNMTQEDLAERCGLFRTYLSRIETGVANPTLTMIYALASSLGVTASALLSPAPIEAAPPADVTAEPLAVAAKPRLSRGRVTGSRRR